MSAVSMLHASACFLIHSLFEALRALVWIWEGHSDQHADQEPAAGTKKAAEGSVARAGNALEA